MYRPNSYDAPDIMGAFYDFLELHIAGKVPASHIIRGWENRAALPPHDNRYIIYAFMGSDRVGTNAISDVQRDGTISMRTMYHGRVQIDFCSDTDESREWAAYIDSIVRSPIGVEFFNPYKFSTLYSEQLQSVEYVDGSDQYIKRTILTIHICYSIVSSFELDFADKVAMSRIEDVDVHHKP